MVHFSVNASVGFHKLIDINNRQLALLFLKIKTFDSLERGIKSYDYWSDILQPRLTKDHWFDSL